MRKLSKIYESLFFESITLDIMRHDVKAPNMGDMFGQDVEPAGLYVLHKDFEGDVLDNWITGTTTLNNPMIIDVTDDTQISYKRDLALKYKGKKQVLTKKLMALGYDAIICRYPKGDYGEIVLFPNAKYMLDK